MIDPRSVAAAHDQMAGEYDRLDDPWYSWLFVRLHEFIAEHLPLNDGRRVAVDAGCGTGFQSFLLARSGHQVIGFDLAGKLLDIARTKAPAHARPPLEAPPLFVSSAGPSWVRDHHRRLAEMLERSRAGRRVVAPRFEIADLRSFDFEAVRPNVITCCGSVLSFVDSYRDVIANMARGLAPGGRVFLEVEQKANLDLLWPLVDVLTGGNIGYEQRIPDILRNLLGTVGRSVRIDYPFDLSSGETLCLPIWLFSVRDLGLAFADAGLRVVARQGVHHATNLLPSVILDDPSPSRNIRRAFDALRAIDQRLGGAWPFWRLGCSIFFCLERAR
jgi:SAM-dependent methyltransferase